METLHLDKTIQQISASRQLHPNQINQWKKKIESSSLTSCCIKWGKKTTVRSLCLNGGEKGIRTLDTVARIHAFQACAFNHSATSPARLQYNGKDSEFKRKLHFIQEKVTHSSLSAEILATDSRRVS